MTRTILPFPVCFIFTWGLFERLILTCLKISDSRRARFNDHCRLKLIWSLIFCHSGHHVEIWDDDSVWAFDYHQCFWMSRHLISSPGSLKTYGTAWYCDRSTSVGVHTQSNVDQREADWWSRPSIFSIYYNWKLRHCNCFKLSFLMALILRLGCLLVNSDHMVKKKFRSLYSSV